MSAINQALGYQQTGLNQAENVMGDIWGQTQNNMAPYLQAGGQAVGELNALAGQTYGNPNIPTDYQSILNDPMYQFGNQQSEEMLRRNLVGGIGLDNRHAANMFGTLGMQNALMADDRIYNRNADNFSRQNQQGQDLFNKQYSVAGLGQNMAANQAQFGGAYAQSMGDMYTGYGNAAGSATLSNDALGRSLDQNQNALWAGLGGAALGNLGSWEQGGGGLLGAGFSAFG